MLTDEGVVSESRYSLGTTIDWTNVADSSDCQEFANQL